MVKALGILRSMYKLYNGMLVGLVGGQVQVARTITLQFNLKFQPWIKSVEVNFLIVSTYNNAYNAILRRPFLNKIGAIISTPYLLMKFSTNQAIGKV